MLFVYLMLRPGPSALLSCAASQRLMQSLRTVTPKTLESNLNAFDKPSTLSVSKYSILSLQRRRLAATCVCTAECLEECWRGLAKGRSISAWKHVVGRKQTRQTCNAQLGYSHDHQLAVQAKCNLYQSAFGEAYVEPALTAGSCSQPSLHPL